MTWTTADIAGKRADTFQPLRAPTGIVLFLHGYDGVTLRENAAYATALERHGLACICPHAPRCWWTDAVYVAFDATLSPLEFLRGPVLEFIQRTWNIAPPRIAVMGVEMGGQGALQLAYRYARQFPVVAAVSPKVDFESWHGHGTSLDELFPNRESARQHTATLHVHPLDWPKLQLLLCDPADEYCIDGVRTLASKLYSSGIPFEKDLETTHGGYGWNYANAMAERVVAFLARGIEDLRLRQEAQG